MNKLKGIIFDMDGVLVKTIHIAEKVARKNLGEHNITLTQKDIENLAGFSWKEFLGYIYTTRKIKPIKNLYEKILKTYSRLLEEEVVIYEGANDVLKALKPKYQLALVSGSSKENILTNLEKFNLRDFFQVIISAEEAERGKPAPDLYLIACERLGLKPDECLGVEDSILGVKAVKNAGMLCIAITNTVGKEKLQEADIILSSIKEVPSAIGRLTLKVSD